MATITYSIINGEIYINGVKLENRNIHGINRVVEDHTLSYNNTLTMLVGDNDALFTIDNNKFEVGNQVYLLNGGTGHMLINNKNIILHSYGGNAIYTASLVKITDNEWILSGNMDPTYNYNAIYTTITFNHTVIEASCVRANKDVILYIMRLDNNTIEIYQSRFDRHPEFVSTIDVISDNDNVSMEVLSMGNNMVYIFNSAPSIDSMQIIVLFFTKTAVAEYDISSIVYNANLNRGSNLYNIPGGMNTSSKIVPYNDKYMLVNVDDHLCISEGVTTINGESVATFWTKDVYIMSMDYTGPKRFVQFNNGKYANLFIYYDSMIVIQRPDGTVKDFWSGNIVNYPTTNNGELLEVAIDPLTNIICTAYVQVNRDGTGMITSNNLYVMVTNGATDPPLFDPSGRPQVMKKMFAQKINPHGISVIYFDNHFLIASSNIEGNPVIHKFDKMGKYIISKVFTNYTMNPDTHHTISLTVRTIKLAMTVCAAGSTECLVLNNIDI